MKFPGVESLETAPKFRKRKKNLLSCVCVLHKTSHQEISRSRRAVTAKQCTKKCNVRAVVVLVIKPVALLDVLIAIAIVVAKAPQCHDGCQETNKIIDGCTCGIKVIHNGSVVSGEQEEKETLA